MSTDELRSSRYRSLHEALSGYVDRGEVPGLVYAIEQGGDSAIEVVGNRMVDGPAMTRDTIFRIASMTKPVIAAATMILVENGRLSLDEPVDEFLPELANRSVLRSVDAPLDDTVPATRSISVRDLLTFRPGFGIVMAPPGAYPIQRAMEELELGQGPPNPARLPSPDEWMRRLGLLPLVHQPGEVWMYNTAADVLGVLISRVAGESLESFLRDRIFDPLGMDDTGFSVPESKIDRLATSYGIDPDTGAFEVYDPPREGQWSRPPRFPSGAGGLVSTIDDYLAFARMMRDNGVCRDQRVLGEHSLELMTTDHLTAAQRQAGQPILATGTGWGFGMAVVSVPDDIPCSAGTYGWNGGLGTNWCNDPATGATLILLTQVNWSSPAFPTIARDFLTTGFTAVAEPSPAASREGRDST